MTGTPDYPVGCPWRDLAEVLRDRPKYRRGQSRKRDFVKKKKNNNLLKSLLQVRIESEGRPWDRRYSETGSRSPARW